jgi:hypothetical protein
MNSSAEQAGVERVSLRPLLGREVFDAEAARLGRLVERGGQFFAVRAGRRLAVAPEDVLIAGPDAIYLRLLAVCYGAHRPLARQPSRVRRVASRRRPEPLR